ncbi:MAG: hypothetical protein AAFV53_42055, partial [Myxococcota bacterium]
GRLCRAPRTAADIRPALMSLVALMILLVPLMLMTTSAQKLTGLPLSVPGPTDALPPTPPGPVEDLTVRRADSGFQIEAALRSTDVRAAVGDTEMKVVFAADLSALQDQLWTLKQLDPDRERIHLVPSADTPTELVVRWMDAVRISPRGTLYPKVVLETAQ